MVRWWEGWRVFISLFDLWEFFSTVLLKNTDPGEMKMTNYPGVPNRRFMFVRPVCYIMLSEVEYLIGYQHSNPAIRR